MTSSPKPDTLSDIEHYAGRMELLTLMEESSRVARVQLCRAEALANQAAQVSEVVAAPPSAAASLLKMDGRPIGREMIQAAQAGGADPGNVKRKMFEQAKALAQHGLAELQNALAFAATLDRLERAAAGQAAGGPHNGPLTA